MLDRIWDEILGEGPLVAVAIHDGHEVREDVLRLLALEDEDRRREEDPYTGLWTSAAPTRMIGRRSRFEVDLNRPRENAIYESPEDAWGLEVWRSPLTKEIREQSLEEYDRFYERLKEILDEKVELHGKFVVLDLHSYNHRRAGSSAPAASAEENPQVNLGTGSMPRERWAPLVDRFLNDLTSYEFPGGPLDVRENVRFRGGHLPRWVHENYPEQGCALALEFKKTFMDEWTGEPIPELVDAIGSALAWTATGLTEELSRL